MGETSEVVTACVNKKVIEIIDTLKCLSDNLRTYGHDNAKADGVDMAIEEVEKLYRVVN